MQKTLGGDRLSSGNRMKVHLHGYERSTHDLSYLWRSTMSAGTLVPFLSEVALPGDTFDITLDVRMNTHPTIGPLFGSYKTQLDVFVCPIRLYNSFLHNNALGIGMNMANIKLPIITLTALPETFNGAPDDFDNMQINPSCLLSYLGIRGIGNNPETTATPRTFNALPILSYWDIYKQYYSNKMEELGAVIHTPAVALIQTIDDIQITVPTETAVPLPQAPTEAAILIRNNTLIEVNYTGTTPLPEQIMLKTSIGTISLLDIAWGNSITNTGTALTAHIQKGTIYLTNWNYATGSEVNSNKPEVVLFDLNEIDTMRQEILSFNTPGTAFDINTPDLEPYTFLAAVPNGIPNSLQNQEGLAVKTYQSDLFNNWMNTEWIDGPGGVNDITAVDTSSGSFNIDTLILSKKVYELLTRIAVSGGTYDDWLDVAYDHPRHERCESPMYVGGLIKELIFQEVVSNSASDTQDGTQQLGTLAGKGTLADKHKGGKVIVKCDEPSYIIGIISLTPRVDYSQGNKWDIHLKTMDDFHKPGLDQIGFQELITEQMAWWDTNYDADTATWIQKSAGKQPAWINYMTNVNRCYGNFAIGNGNKVGEMFMTLNRRYELDTTLSPSIIKDLTTYIDPSKFNFIFAETSLDAQNFWAQISVDMIARRKMSAKIMPNL